jgi:hypothetical protein
MHLPPAFHQALPLHKYASNIRLSSIFALPARHLYTTIPRTNVARQAVSKKSDESLFWAWYKAEILLHHSVNGDSENPHRPYLIRYHLSAPEIKHIDGETAHYASILRTSWKEYTTDFHAMPLF